MSRPAEHAPVALITGAARRIGAAIARRLHARGARVVVHHHRSSAAAAHLCEALAAKRPGSAVCVGANLRDPASAGALVNAATGAFGRLDVLVNNASSFFPTPLESADEAAWDDLIDTNLKAPLRLAIAAAPHLREAHGCIVNLADIHARRPMAGHAVYCAAKAGLVMLTRSLALELGPQIRANAVAPGAILWPEDGDDPDARAAVIARTPLARTGEPEEVAAAVAFLAFDAPFTTGAVLPVDGGRHAGPD